MNVAIIGCGLIGRKRALALREINRDKLVIVCDLHVEQAKNLAEEFNCEFDPNWENVVIRSDIDVVINASINNVLEPITVSACESGKHVLCEKPLGRNSLESTQMVNEARTNNVVLKTGFNHRFHPAIWRAKQFLDEGKIGKCFSIRARYGHGGRPGMEREWRASKELCGGGELLDQGVHVIDLIRWFGGEITEVFGKVETKFWNMEVEENASAILKTTSNVTASFSVSWTNWRNVFSFEVFGTEGYLSINGLGGSYGMESLEWGRRKKEGGRPDIETFEFPSEDVSWVKEWEEFRNAILEKRDPIGSGDDGLCANKVIEAIYESSLSNTVVQIKSTK